MFSISGETCDGVTAGEINSANSRPNGKMHAKMLPHLVTALLVHYANGKKTEEVEDAPNQETEEKLLINIDLYNNSIIQTPKATPQMELPSVFNGTLNATVEPCVGDEEFCNMTEEEYILMLNKYIYPQPYEWVLIATHCMVFTMGLIGNALVCIAVYRNHTMRNVTNYFIVNLAVADFMVIAFCLPPTVLWDVTETWFLGDCLCKVLLYFQVSLLFCLSIYCDRLLFSICLFRWLLLATSLLVIPSSFWSVLIFFL